MPELKEMMKRQQVLAAFGEFAINSDNLDAVLLEACRLVGEATGTGRAKVLEIQEGRQELFVRAGVGWAPDVVGMVRLQMGDRSSETYAIKAAKPIVSQDITKDDRFEVPYFMKEAGVVALVNVPIFVPGQRPYGVLQIDDTRPRQFGDDEIEFLRTYAMILGPVIDRLHLVEERARDRDVIRAGEARHSLLIGSWAQAEWESNPDGVVITDSPTWRAYTGQSIEQWLGYGWLDAIHPDDRAYTEKQWREAIAAHGLVDAEFRLHAPGGGWRWTNVRAAPVLDADGSIVKWVGMNIDIDARKLADAALLKSEAQFRALATVGSSSVYRMSPDWSEMHNLEGAAFLADTEIGTVGWIDRYIPPSERPLVRETINRAIAAKAVFELEHRVLLADGTVGWTSSRAAPLLNDAGEITEWFGAATDVTARVKADRLFTRLFQASPAPFLVLKPDAPRFTITDVNDAYLSATMRTRDEVVGHGVFEVYPDNPSGEVIGGVSPLRASFEKVLASRQPDVLPGLKYDVARPNGTFEERWWNPVNTAVLDDNGEVEAIIHNANDVTEERRAELALRESEGRFRQFSDSSTSILWIRDAETLQMEFASPAYDLIYGIAGPDRGGDARLRGWARSIVPEDRKLVLTNFQHVRAGERVEQEFRIRRKSDGEVRWIRDVEFPLTDEQGHVQRVAGVGQDITAQKQAEEALREREERLSLIVENARDYAIFTIDPGGKITDWRGGAEAVFGWSRAEAIGMDARHLFTPEDRAADELEREMTIARDEGRAPDIRWHIRKDGSRVFIDGSLTLLGDGTTTSFLKIGQDVTERHRVEAALSASEGRLQTLMEGIPQLVWRSCDKGLWTWASPQWLEFTGQSQEESQNLGWLDVIHPDDHEATKLAWAAARPHGMLDVEYRVRRAADGAWFWHHTRSVPVRNDEGDIIEWLGTSTDVQMLKEFQERQSVLVAELQHRTRNLIAIVRSTSDKTARASANLTDFRGRFRDRLDALARVQGLLSRLNDLERVTFDDLIKTEMTAMDSDPERVTLEGPPGIRLRSSTVQTLAMGLHELATNAVKYGALGQPDARLAVTWRWEPAGEGDKPWLHIDWRETGVTIAPTGTTPRGSGQGRELIERALPYQLRAKTSYELGRDGVHCTISFPVSATTDSEEDHD